MYYVCGRHTKVEAGAANALFVDVQLRKKERKRYRIEKEIDRIRYIKYGERSGPAMDPWMRKR